MISAFLFGGIANGHGAVLDVATVFSVSIYQKPCAGNSYHDIFGTGVEDTVLLILGPLDTTLVRHDLQIFAGKGVVEYDVG
jgi:hypothetical protein